MHRLPLVTLCVASILGSAQILTAAPGKHFDPSRITKPCSPCHSGHGVAGSPMLSKADDELCLSCHDAEGAIADRRSELGLAQSARPGNMRTEMSKPVTHRGARCIDCHSLHGVELDHKPPAQPLGESVLP